MAAPKTDPLLGTTLGGVQLSEKLGAGGMGSVYLGVQTALGRKVAVKILPDHLSRDTEYIARFQREATSAGKLEHPNIVAVYDIGHQDGKYFIVMQYVEGESLQAALDVMGALHPRDAAQILVGVLDGLQHAHDQGIVHRDVKPDNVLLTKNNQPKILDFGLAISTEAERRLTETNTVVGTPYFISPEQAKGRPAIPASDVYSAGVMLYYLVTGRVPFSGQNALAILNKHIHETPVSPVNLNPKVPPALNGIVLRMMAKRPEDRYRTAAAAMKDLQAFLEGRSPTALPRQTSTVSQRRPAVLWPWIAGGVAAAFLAGVVLLAGNDRPNRPTPSPTPFPMAASPSESPELAQARRDVAEIQTEASVEAGKSQNKDFAVFVDCLRRLDLLATRFANHKGIAPIVEAGRRSVRESAELEAKNIADSLRARLEAARAAKDPFVQRRILLEFPQALREITDTGRGLKEDLKKVEAAIVARCREDVERTIPGLIKADAFEEARTQIEYLQAHAPAEFRDALVRLKDRLGDTEAERRAQLLPKMAAEVSSLEDSVYAILARRETDGAWKAVLDFVERPPAGSLPAQLIRPGQLAASALRSVTPSRDGEKELAAWLDRVEKDGAVGEANLPGSRVSLLLSQVLHAEWLFRRGARGVLRLDGLDVALEAFDRAPGRLVAPVSLDQPYLYAPASGPERSFQLRELPPCDGAFLAAVAEWGAEGRAERALEGPDQGRLCQAIAAGYVASAVPDRWSQARRWLEAARSQGAAVPAHQLDDAAERAELERERLGREILKQAQDHAAARRYEAAHKALDEALKENAARDHATTVEAIVREARSRYLIEEATQARSERAWSRVRQLCTRLIKEDPTYRADAVAELYGMALLNTGSWVGMPLQTPKPTGSVWTWPGKTTGTPAPARYADNCMVLQTSTTLFIERAKTEGCTGFRAKVKINQLQQAFDVGLIFDGQDMLGDMRRVIARSTGKIEVSSRTEEKWELDVSEDAPAKPATKEFYEIALVTDGNLTIVFFGKLGKVQPVFSLLKPMDPKGLLGLWATAEASFMDVQVRDGKN